MAATSNESNKASVIQGGRTMSDPTRLTTEAFDKLERTLKELFEEKISSLQVLVEEKFRGVDQQFAGRDTALVAALLAQKILVEEQNASSAMATAKSEASFTKQIDGIGSLITGLGEGFTARIEAVKEIISVNSKTAEIAVADVKTRLTTIESRKEGGMASWAIVVGVIGASAGIASIIGLIFVVARGG